MILAFPLALTFLVGFFFVFCFCCCSDFRNVSGLFQMRYLPHMNLHALPSCFSVVAVQLLIYSFTSPEILHYVLSCLQ